MTKGAVNATLCAPVAGQLNALTTIDDPVFSKGLMGVGFAIDPTDGAIHAPVSGQITMVAETKHAVGIHTASGLDVLLHLGIDTVELAGAPYELAVKANDQVIAGQPIVTMDLAAVKKAGKATTVITVITNTQALHLQIFLKATGVTVNANDVVAVATNPEVALSSADDVVSTDDAIAVAATPASEASAVGDGQYDQLAHDIIQGVGGAVNVNNLIHCITRLRFYLKDEAKAQTAKIENLDGVIDVTKAAGQYQVVIGPAVSDVYDAVIGQLGPQYAGDGAATTQPLPAKDQPTTPWGKVKQGFSSLIGVMTASMVPVIGILAGSGILKGILAALTGFKVLSTTSGTYMVLNAVGDATFYFLPIILGFTAAKKLGSNPIVLAVVGGILVYPNLIQAAGKAATAQITVLGLPTHLVAYSASVFPIIVAAWLGSHVEKWLKKVVPLALRSVFVPILEALILGLVVLIVVGPLITVISQGLANAIITTYNFSPALSGLVIGGLYQTMVIFGLHWSLIPIVINDLATNGHSYLNALISVTMVAQGGAVLAVFLKTRNKKLKELSLAAAVSAFCGVTEPAIYGVNLKYKRVFIVGSIAGALGGLVAGLLRVNNYALSGSLIGFPAFITPDVGIGSNFYSYLISHYGTLLISTVAVYFLGFSDKMVTKKAPASAPTES
ncbi:PTS beta-glucoside transporter subunit IIABC [Lactiplantibacillus garii]|uniref:PTS beta-glucoside transporter subunit IIABC n=1 Tax=Lactiplantibacillus garii TaxID=2306423 RepID=A0A426D7I1_9LACO|nr:PTS glucose transporter subunit IIABC [Lactiplantibacillus garii]RRK10546.1 PTS beta-glucoside transporter subunit IIABC [Lactiplantibacillus garii]